MIEYFALASQVENEDLSKNQSLEEQKMRALS